MKKIKVVAAAADGETVSGTELEAASVVHVALAGWAELEGLPGFEDVELKVFVEVAVVQIMPTLLVSPTVHSQTKIITSFKEKMPTARQVRY